MRYNFKLVQELAWAGVAGLTIFLIELFANFDPDTVQDWETWLTAAGGGAVRAFFGAALATLRRGR